MLLIPTKHKPMSTKVLWLLIIMNIINISAISQPLVGIKTIDANGQGQNNFTSLKSAIDSLNKYGVGSGGVIFNINNTHQELAPKGGYQIFAEGTEQNKIIFKKAGIGNNPTFISFTGDSLFSNNSFDGIISLIGADYIELNGLDFKENVNNSDERSRMEFAIGIFNNLNDNISKHVIIKNCKIELNRNQIAQISNSNPLNASAGILILSSPYNNLPEESNITQSDRFISIINNTITNTNYGISAIGHMRYFHISKNIIDAIGNITFNAVNSANIFISNIDQFNIDSNTIRTSFTNNLSNQLKRTYAGINITNDNNSKTNGIIASNNFKLTSKYNVNNIEAISINNADSIHVKNNIIDTIHFKTYDSSSITLLKLNNVNYLNVHKNTFGPIIYSTNNYAKCQLRVIYANNSNETFIDSNKISPIVIDTISMNNHHFVYLIEATNSNKISITNNDIQTIISKNRSSSRVFDFNAIKTKNNTSVLIDRNKIYSLNPNQIHLINGIIILADEKYSIISHNIIENISTTSPLKAIEVYNKNQKGIRQNSTCQISYNSIQNIFCYNNLFAAIRTVKSKADVYNNKINNVGIKKDSNSPNQGNVIAIYFEHSNQVRCFNNSISNLKNECYSSFLNAEISTTGIKILCTRSDEQLFEIFNNSIHVLAYNTSEAYTSSCITQEVEGFDGAKGTLYLYNNIMMNFSNVGSYQTSHASIIKTNTTKRLETLHNGTNNNIYYLGTSKIRRYFYINSIDVYINLNTYKAFCAPRESKTITGNVNFSNVAEGDLSINDSSISYAESNGKYSFNNNFDIDNKKRPGYANSKYNSGYGVDIGAYEFDGVDTNKTDINPPILFLDSSSAIIDPCNDTVHTFLLKTVDKSGVVSAFLYWKTHLDSLYQKSNCNRISDSTFVVKLNLNNPEIIYYFDVTDSVGNTSTTEPFKYITTKIYYTQQQSFYHYSKNDTIKIKSPINTVGSVGFNQSQVIDYNSMYNYSKIGKNYLALYTADELKNAGVKKGIINSLGIINNNQSNSKNNIIDYYNIAIANTNFNAIKNLSDLNFIEVINATDVWPKKGLNTHEFTTPFYWDGESNIIIRFCGGPWSYYYEYTNWNSYFYTTNDSMSCSSNRNNPGFPSNCDDFTIEEYYKTKPILSIGNLVEADNYYWSSTQPNANIVSSNSEELIAVPLDTGVYTYTRTIIIQGCNYTDTFLIHVSTKPFLNLPDTLETCSYDLIEIDAQNHGCTYEWYYKDVFISNNQKIYARSIGKYKVRITNNLGNNFIDSTYLKLKNATPVFIGFDTYVCEGDSLILTSNVDADRYVWSRGDTTRSIIVNQTGKYSLKVFYNVGCEFIDDRTIDFDHQVYLNPYEFYYPDTASYKYFSALNFHQDEVDIRWDMDDPLSAENIKYGRIIKHKFISPKNEFNIKVYGWNIISDCEIEDSLLFTLVNINQEIIQEDFSIHSNPITEDSRLDYFLSKNNNQLKIQLLDLLGRELINYTDQDNVNTGHYKLALNNILELPKGIYILQININKETRVFKLTNN